MSQCGAPFHDVAVNLRSVTILGAGAWGTALAVCLTSYKVFNKITLWTRNSEHVQAMLTTGFNYKIDSVPLPQHLRITSDFEVVATSDVIFIAVPACSLREVSATMAKRELIKRNTIIIATCKGIEPETCALPHDIIGHYWLNNPICILSGASFAKEIATNALCGLVLASKHRELGQKLARLLSQTNMVVEYSDDIIGIGIWGAMKNVIAIACGLSAHIGYGAKAIILTNGLQEIHQLHQAMLLYHNEKPNNVLNPNIATVGDLVMTCMSQQSRNTNFGIKIAQGEPIQQILSTCNSTVEGIRSVAIAKTLSAKYNVPLPICQAVYDIIYNKADAKHTIQRLLRVHVERSIESAHT